jgi:hypothetical protein
VNNFEVLVFILVVCNYLIGWVFGYLTGRACTELKYKEQKRLDDIKALNPRR